MAHTADHGKPAEHQRPASSELRADADPAPPPNVRPNADGSVPDHWVRDMMDGMTEQVARARMRRAPTRWTRATSTPTRGTSPPPRNLLQRKTRSQGLASPDNGSGLVPGVWLDQANQKTTGQGALPGARAQVRGSDEASDGSEVLLQQCTGTRGTTLLQEPYTRMAKRQPSYTYPCTNRDRNRGTSLVRGTHNLCPGTLIFS